MRKIIIDTDTGSDDAVALLMALKCADVEVAAITTVAGNVTLGLATKNALATVEVAQGQTPPVYTGADKPLRRDLITAKHVHGEDGMGDMGLIRPTREAEAQNAVDAILEIVAANRGEIEIVTIGPVTNIAMAIRKAPDEMRGVKRIWAMGTGGFGPGNVTPVAEFNVYVDAESFAIMLGAGIPVTIIGFDLCLGDAALNEAEIDMLLQSGKEAAVFAVECSKTMLALNKKNTGKRFLHLPDPVAVAVCLWSDIVIVAEDCNCYVCTQELPTYGQVILHDESRLASEECAGMSANATVIKSIDTALFRARMIELLMR